MRKIKSILIIIFTIFLVLIISNCYSNFKATLKLVNNYSEKVVILFGTEDDYVNCTDATTCELDEEQEALIVAEAESNNEDSYTWELKMNSYEERDWAVWYRYEVGEDEFEWDYIELSEVNDGYLFQMQRVYVVTVDEELNVSIEIESE